ncbi:DUF2878 domain-containing protein [Aurantivibrio infirmus]
MVDTKLKCNSDVIRKLLNILFFQIAWFSCLLLEENWSLLITATILFLHQLLIVRNTKEWLFIFTVAFLGVVADSLFSLVGVLNFSEKGILIPIWLACIWLVFATTLNHSFIWLKNNLFLAAVLGAIGGPMSYFAGTKLSDVSFSSSFWDSLLFLMVFWAIFFPSSMYVVKKISLTKSNGVESL